MKQLNKDNVPRPLHHLIPMVERWGIVDDYDREQAVSNSSEEDLLKLIHSIDAAQDDDLFCWLEGAESKSRTPTEEYVAFTCYTMAIDSANVKFKKARKRNEAPKRAL